MKNTVLWFLLILVSACTKNDPEPDLTKDFIGIWKSETEENEDWTYDFLWTIDKVSSSEVRILIKERRNSKIASNLSYEIDGVFDNVKISKDRIMLLDIRTIDNGVITETKGTGIIKGNVLSVAATTHNTPEGTVSAVFNLKKL